MDYVQLNDRCRVNVSRETHTKLVTLVDLVIAESENQNLVAASTLIEIWSRHIVDSLQLLKFADGGPWLDLGTGAGFPGLVIAICGIDDVYLVEERRLRYEFLDRAVIALGLKNVSVLGSRVEKLDSLQVQTISARAFAPLDKIFALSNRFATESTRWILPKGRKAHEELESVRATWHGDFRLEPSVTDPTSSIIIAENLSPKGPR